MNTSKSLINILLFFAITSPAVAQTKIEIDQSISQVESGLMPAIRFDECLLDNTLPVQQSDTYSFLSSLLTSDYGNIHNISYISELKFKNTKTKEI